jgi:tetratricopeptide (TPR) repeat protein
MIPRWNKLILAVLAIFGAVECGGCQSSSPSTTAHKDIEQSQLASAASAAFERGRIEEAENLYRRQLTLALASDDPTSISDAEYNIALCLMRRGRAAEAAPLLTDAETEIRRAGESATDIVLLRAVAARSQNRHVEAITLARQVLSTRGTTPAQRVQAHVIAGLSQFSLGVQTSAEVELSKAKQDAPKVADAGILAGVAELSGRIAEGSGHPDAAAGDYDEQAQLLNQAGLYRDMSDALQHAGAAFRSAGISPAAADRFYRSARSLAAQGDPAAATSIARLAVESAANTGDAALIARITALVNELAATTQAARP